MYAVDRTDAAKSQTAAIVTWLRANADATQFIDELERALQALAVMPWCGPPVVAMPDVRRLLLRRSRVYVYYSVDEDSRIVMIRAVWHTARGEPPTL